LLVVPKSRDFLLEREVVNIRPNREHLDIYDQWAVESEETDLTTWRTTQLIHQLDARDRTRRGVLVGNTGGLITLTTVVADLCLTRRSQMTAFLRRRGATPKLQDAAEEVERETRRMPVRIHHCTLGEGDITGRRTSEPLSVLSVPALNPVTNFPRGREKTRSRPT
jgi:hypothetical protein